MSTFKQIKENINDKVIGQKYLYADLTLDVPFHLCHIGDTHISLLEKMGYIKSIDKYATLSMYEILKYIPPEENTNTLRIKRKEMVLRERRLKKLNKWLGK